MILRFIQSHRYNTAVLECTKRLVRQHFTERQFLIERTSTDYLNGSDSRRYTEFFRKNNVSIELAAIHYFDFGITQLKRLLNMSDQDDVADLVEEMEHGLDQMLSAYLSKVALENGTFGDALSVFISGLDRQAAEHTGTVSGPDSDVRPVGE